MQQIKQCTDWKERKLIKIWLRQEAEELKEYCQIVKTKINILCKLNSLALALLLWSCFPLETFQAFKVNEFYTQTFAVLSMKYTNDRFKIG